MAGVKISNLPAVPVAPALGDLLAEVQPAVGGTTYKATLSQIATLFNSNLSFVPLAGGTMTGALILNTSSPTTDLQAASKGYVDTVATGLEIQPSCRVATTGALTVTYANGSSGVGATLTNAGALAALSIDGVALAVGNRVLVKNQASALQNGIYTVTNIGSGAVNWVMTRATDYDTPAEIQPGDFVLIDEGTTNTTTSWVQTATVTAVGVDAINFSQFSVAPTSLIRSVVTQVFTSNGTYTPTSGMRYCIVEIVGGGGGSGGTVGAAGQTGTSAAGGGGGYCRKTYTAANIGANSAVVIGAAGTAGTAGNNTGGTGGTSTFTPSGTGLTLTATGGVGGAGGSASATTQSSGDGGVGGTGTNGDVNIRGGVGGSGITVVGSGGQAIGGPGGASFLSTPVGAPSGGGNAGNLYGGGAASSVNASGVNAAGQAGAAGICIVTEFCSGP